MPNVSKKLYFKYFFGRNCAKCAAQKTQDTLKSLESRKYVIEKYDSGEVDGLTEATYCGVWSFPTLVLIMEYKNGQHTETMLGRWVGVPDLGKIDEVLRENNA